MNRKIVRIVLVIVCICLVAASYLLFAGKRLIKADSGYQLVMGTFARVVAIAEDSGTAQECIRAGLAEIHRVDELMSDYKSDSEISRVNRDAAGEPVQVGEWTYEVLKRSIQFSKFTGGAFDITIGPLMVLFHAAQKQAAEPSEEQIADAKSKVGFEKLKLDDENKTVRFAVEGMRLDLGGIAKGYAIDKAVEAARRCGAVGAMVDIGGDIRCFGTPPEGKDSWVIGVQDPNSVVEGIGGSGLLMTLKVANEAVATSGDYQQFVMIEGKRRSHIMNRTTGSSAEGLSSVTIIADNATDADALATAVSVMGAEKGLALIEKLPGTEAILITSGPKCEVIKTAGAEKYIQ
ncbi:MAG: FAD:protein FMN transferase [Planctomycetota bacterium]